MAATTLAALVAQAQTDVPIIQAALAARQASLDTAHQAVQDTHAAMDNLNNQLRERLLILRAAAIVVGNQTLDPVAP